MYRPFRSILALILFVSLLTACAPDAAPPVASASVVEAMSAASTEGYARATAPRPFTFPADHGPHAEYATEWWYYTGNLTGGDGAASGADYGYQLTFFRSAVTPEMVERESDLAASQIYMAHFAVTDGAGRRHHSFDRFSRGAGELAGATGDPGYAVWLEDWQATEISPGVQELRAQADGPDGPIAIAFTLTESREPVLHGDAGLSQKGPEAGNASFYYSLVGLETAGSITLGPRTVDVAGLSWFDHEFGTSALSGDAVGWDWFSLQLDNGGVLMFAQIRSRTGAAQDIFEGALVAPDGTQRTILPADFVLTPTAQWTSPRSAATYPVAWAVTFPELAIDLTITPLIQDQEMAVTFTYWEGAVAATGTYAGAPITARGYVELTGYAEGGGGYQR